MSNKETIRGWDYEVMKENINHPEHYGGEDNPYEAIKIIEAWGLNFNLGNVAKYVSRAGKKGDALQDLEKAKWYLEREINNLVICRDVNRYKSTK